MRNTLILISLWITLSIVVVACHSSLASSPSLLEQALLKSGSNRSELEKVLAHYSQRETDSLKLQAATFFIENIPGHYFYYGASLDEYRDSVNRSAAMRKLPWHIRQIFHQLSSYQACLYVNSRMMEEMNLARLDSVCFSHLLVGKKDVLSFGCPEFVPVTVLVMRALGIPVSAESIEQWSSRSGKHYWNAVYHFTGLHYPFTGFESRPRGLNQDYKMNKVYRHTYRHNPRALIDHADDESVPIFFENRFLQDVTSEYMTCHDITVSLDYEPDDNQEYAYLCVFNNSHWIPVHYGKRDGLKVTFTDIGPETMFVAGYFQDDEIQPASLPFYVRLDGTGHYISPYKTEQVSLTIHRKYPLFHRLNKNTQVVKIKYLPRTDSNHVMVGDTYELLYYNNYTFQLIGKQETIKPFLTFQEIPMGGLYLLVDKNRGKEHRIFTIGNEKVRFW